MDKRPMVERRRAQRQTTRIEAVLQHGTVRSHVMILDYERTGLQLWVRTTLTPETEVTLYVAGYEIPAKVQWCEGKSAGVSLLQPLDHDLQHMLDVAKQAVPDAS